MENIEDINNPKINLHNDYDNLFSQMDNTNNNHQMMSKFTKITNFQGVTSSKGSQIIRSNTTFSKFTSFDSSIIDFPNKHAIHQISNNQLGEDFLPNSQIPKIAQPNNVEILSNLNEIKDLIINKTSSKIYKWCFKNSVDDISPNWTIFKDEENDLIEAFFSKFCISNVAQLYETEKYSINFSNLSIKSKIDCKTHELSLSIECPQNLQRENYFNHEIKPQKLKSTKISDNTLHKIKKDYFLTFKNIFPSKKYYENTRVYWKKQDNSFIIHFFTDEITKEANFIKPSDNVLNTLKKKNYVEICQIIRNPKSNEQKICFKKKISIQVLTKFFKYHWCHKHEDFDDQVWKLFSKDENYHIDHHYKHNYIQNQEEKVSFISSEDKFEINFHTNKFIKNNESEKRMIRFHPKYSIPDDITMVVVPHELFKKTDLEKPHPYQNIHYNKKSGPKHFYELINQIRKELKDESESLNKSEMYTIYEERFLNKIRPENFIPLIIKIYLEEGFIYERITKILRFGKYEDFSKIQYFYFSLLYSLQTINSNKQNTDISTKGIYLRNDLLDFSVNDIKDTEIILFKECLPFCSNKINATKYAEKEGFLLEIEIPENL